MFRRRLRPAWTGEELARIYAAPHDHRIYGAGHDVRVRQTVALGRWVCETGDVRSAADLSCGNGAIVDELSMARPMRVHKGDYAPGYEHTGPIELTLNDIPDVDLFVLSETVEHLDDPDAVLARIRQMAARLLLSTPIGEDDLGNPEHYWGWDQEAVGAMLAGAGWDAEGAMRVDVLVPRSYSYQIWACGRAEA